MKDIRVYLSLGVKKVIGILTISFLLFPSLTFSKVGAGFDSSKSYEAQYIYGVDSFLHGDYLQAISFLTKAIELNPGFKSAYIVRSFCFCKLNRLSEANDDMKKSGDAISNAIIRSEFGQYGLALEEYNKVPDKNEKAFYYNRGTTYLHMEEYNKAIEDFNKDIEVFPQHSEAFNNRGVAYFRLKKYKLAIKDFCDALKFSGVDYPCNQAAIYNAGLFYSFKSIKEFKARMIIRHTQINDYARSIAIIRL